MNEEKNRRTADVKLPDTADEDVVDMQEIYKKVSAMMSLNALTEYNSNEQKKKADREYRKLLLIIIEVADMMDKYFREADLKEDRINAETSKWINSFKGIRRKIGRDLTSVGVVPIEAPEGQAVPGFHTIKETLPAEGIKPGTILQEIKKGYFFEKAVLRKAEVITAE